jgi:oligo-1,6-glucosidase
MTNAGFTSLDQYRDLESINMYHQRVEEAKVQDAASMLHGMAVMSRDNARTPMQWDSSTYAGFTASYAPKEPWISVNPNHTTINAAAEKRDQDSVLAFYRKLIALRHENPVVAAGSWHLLDKDDRQVYAFTRELESTQERLLIIVNLSSDHARIPEQTAQLLGIDHAGMMTATLGAVDPSKVVISNYPDEDTAASLLTGKLSPWEAFAYTL